MEQFIPFFHKIFLVLVQTANENGHSLRELQSFALLHLSINFSFKDPFFVFDDNKSEMHGKENKVIQCHLNSQKIMKY